MTSLLLLLYASALSAAGMPEVSFGGQVRARGESFSVQSYASAPLRRSQDLVSLRSRLHASVAAPEQNLKAFLQIQDSRTAGSEASVSSNEKNVDMHQAYLDVLSLWDAPVDLRLGRFEMAYGDQRQISPLDWHNSGRAWDGGRLKWRLEHGWLDAFLTNTKEVSSARSDGHFWGLYSQCTALAEQEFDAYLLGRDMGDGSLTNEHGTRGNLSDRTLGARIKGRKGDLQWTGEGSWQFGRRAGQRVRAFAQASTLRYTFPVRKKPFLGLEQTFATGDADPFDNQVQAFEPLFTFGHLYYGHQDLFTWKNGHDWVARAGFEPLEGWTGVVEGHLLRLHHSFDGWYDAASAQISRDTTGGAGKNIGGEIDVHFRGPFRKHIDLWFGYSKFISGAFVRRTTGKSDRDWVFLQTAFNF